MPSRSIVSRSSSAGTPARSRIPGAESGVTVTHATVTSRSSTTRAASSAEGPSASTQRPRHPASARLRVVFSRPSPAPSSTNHALSVPLLSNSASSIPSSPNCENLLPSWALSHEPDPRSRRSQRRCRHRSRASTPGNHTASPAASAYVPATNMMPRSFATASALLLLGELLELGHQPLRDEGVAVVVEVRSVGVARRLPLQGVREHAFGIGELVEVEDGDRLLAREVGLDLVERVDFRLAADERLARQRRLIVGRR